MAKQIICIWTHIYSYNDCMFSKKTGFHHFKTQISVTYWKKTSYYVSHKKWQSFTDIQDQRIVENRRSR